MRIYPIIMCGGAGTRLWPVSRPSRPKQFVAFTSEKTLFQETVARVTKINGFQKLLIVAGAAHQSAINSQIGEGLEPVILLEPKGRDSGPAVAAATAWIAEHDSEGIAVIVASDHYIPDAEEFCRVIEVAANASQSGRIVTMGVRPLYPTSAYGYIRPNTDIDNHGVGSVAEFVEKPDAKTAKTYIDKGYLWNSGNFIFPAKTMAAELKRYAPDVFKCAQDGVATAQRSGLALQLGKVFLEAPKISIDYAVMEKTEIASVLPVDLHWSDLGAWDAIAEVSAKNEDGNAVQGNIVTTDTKDCLLRTSGPLIATAGVSNLAIIAEKDAVLVCDLNASQSVKTIVTQLKDNSAQEVDISVDDGFDDLAAMADKYKQWLFTAALPLWSSLGCDHDGWGFHEYLGVDGLPQKTDRRARVQVRQTFVFGKAGQLGWTGPWRSAIHYGFAGLKDYYLRKDGFYRALVGHDGAIVDDTALLYDQAFMLLALSAGHTEIEDAEVRALKLLDLIEGHMRHSDGGFKEASDNPYASNPHMHLFEAVLAWVSISDNTRWHNLAAELADHALTHFMDVKFHFIREFFESDWQPASGPLGAIIEPGHQFEWTWLFLKWHTRSQDDRCLRAAEQLFQIGLNSIDRTRNVGVNQLLVGKEGTTRATEDARLWPQTERLKAALAFVGHSSGQKKAYYAKEALSAGASLWRYLEMSITGLWRDTMQEDGSMVEEPVSASTLYHLISSVEQMLDIVEL